MPKRIPNYFEILITPSPPFTKKIHGIGFRPFIVENSTKFDLHTLPINQPDGSVFIQVWGTESSTEEFMQFLRDNKPQKNADYRVDLISKSYRTQDQFKVLYFIDALTLGQIKRGVDFAINMR